jgi:threonine dehydratase
MRLNAAEMRTVDLSDDDVTTTHLRHLTGGGCAKVENERLFQFVFPEKAGSLKVTSRNTAPSHLIQAARQ